MIEFNNEEFSMVMRCDGYDCDKTLEMYGDFVECIQEAKDNGWKVVRSTDFDGGSYEHFCPRCWANRAAEGVFE